MGSRLLLLKILLLSSPLFIVYFIDIGPMSGKTRNYTDEFKRQIVMLVKSGKSSNSVAKEYGIAKSSVTKWVRDFNNSGSFRAKDNRTPEENELIELRKRVKELEMEADILKQAAL